MRRAAAVTALGVVIWLIVCGSVGFVIYHTYSRAKQKPALPPGIACISAVTATKEPGGRVRVDGPYRAGAGCPR